MRVQAEKAHSAHKLLTEMKQSGLLTGPALKDTLTGCQKIVCEFSKTQRVLENLKRVVSVISNPVSDAEIDAFMHKDKKRGLSC